MAAIATQTIELDLTPGGVSPFLYVSQGDYGTRNLVFNLMLNGQPYTIPSSVNRITLEGVTKRGNLFNVTCTYSGSTATASLTADMTADIGMDICQVVLFDTSGGRLGTANFFIVVEQSPANIKILYGNVYWAELAKSWAVGGTDLRSDEATNNSKYWSIDSKSWAVGGTNTRLDEDTDNAKYYSEIVSDVKPQVDSNTNDVAVLKEQVNQYIVPSEQHPDEVVDARIGFDGTSFDTLGQAVRGQVTTYGYIAGREEIYFRHG